MTTDTMTASSIARAPWYRHRWPWLLMLGPTIVVVAGAVTVWLAVVSDDGLVADDHYRRGLEINRTIERAARAQALDLAAIVDVARDGAVELRLSRGSAEHDAHPPTVQLVLAHPTRAGADVRAVLVRSADDRYRGRIDPPVPGRWRVAVETQAWRLPAVDIDGRIVGVALDARTR